MGKPLLNMSDEIIEWKGAKIYPFAMICDGAELGEGVRVQSFSIVESGAKIGARTTIHPHNLITGHAEIGENCFISSFVGFIDRTRPKNLSDSPFEKTRIGNDVSIGVGATIFPVAIGDGALIGAGAIVLRDVLPGEIVKGIVK